MNWKDGFDLHFVTFQCLDSTGTKVPDVPQNNTVNILWLQEEGAQIHISE
jgi:hypothetical protein